MLLTLFSAASGITVRSYVASGGMVIGGQAGTQYQPGQQTFGYAGSGGMALFGIGVTSKGKSFVASGGQVISGLATTSYTAGAATQIWSYAGTGGMQLAGSANVCLGWAISSAGGMVFGGQAATQYQPGQQTFGYVGSGGLVISGQCISQRVAANESATGGGARRIIAKPRIYAYQGSGQASIGGSADVEFNPVPIRIFNFKPSGGAIFGGQAGIEYHDQIAAVIAADDEWLQLAA
jgi:hypothetical protein